MRSASLLVAAIVAAACCSAFAQDAPGTVGTVTHLSGVLVAKRPDGGTRLLSVQSTVAEGETITTEPNTYARLKFRDDAEVVLRPSSQLKIDAYRYDSAQPEKDSALLSLIKGGLRSVTGLIGKRNRNSVRFTTATATIGIRGTHFGMLFCQSDCAGIPSPSGPPPDGLHVDVVDGSITLTNQAGQQVLIAGQFGYVQNANTAPTIVPPSRGIQVSMPLSISRNAGGGRSIGQSSGLECPVM